jgi:hypothetical protein
MTIRFRTPAGHEPIRVALLTGHTTIIGHDWQELDPRFHREALSLGAQPEGADNPAPPALDAPIDADETEAVRQAIITMLDRNGDGDFTSAGYPDMRVLRGLAGVNVSKELAYAVFETMKAEAAK